MSGVAAASAYSTQPGLQGGPPQYPYGSSVDMEGAVDMVRPWVICC